MQVETDFFIDVSANSLTFGRPVLCYGDPLRDFVDIDFNFSPVKLLPRFTGACILQCFVQVEADFFIYVPSNSATAFMFHVRSTVLLRFAVRQFCELDTSTFVTMAFWLSCSFVTGKSHALGEGRASLPGGNLKVEVSQV